MVDNFIYIPSNDKQNYPFCGFMLLVGKIGQWRFVHRNTQSLKANEWENFCYFQNQVNLSAKFGAWALMIINQKVDVTKNILSSVICPQRS